MRKKRLPYFFLSVSIWFGMYHPLHADYAIRGKPLYAIHISGPSLVESCNEALWVYGVSEKEVWEINPNTWVPVSKTPIQKKNISGTLTALGCKNNELLAASFEKKTKQVLLHRFSKNTPITLPGTGLIRDIACNTKTCFVIRDEVYQSQNFKDWEKIGLPKSAQLPKLKRKGKEQYHFLNWQDSFIVAQGTYIRGLALSNETHIFLDSIRSAVVLRSPQKTEKWESWGFRRGNLLYAKGMALLDNQTLVISDVGLKLLSFFTLEGAYLGSLGADGLLERFGYPVDIATLGHKVYVSDFLNNKLYAFEVEINPDHPKKLGELEVIENLFRNEAVQKNFSEIRCLNCHDGLETYNLERYLNLEGRHHHPTPKSEKVDCFSCHQQHHESPSGTVVSQMGEIETVEKLPFQLRKSIPELCLNCHAEKGKKDQNHFEIKKETLQVKAKQVISCTQCHKMHQSETHLLKEPPFQLCVTCHGKSQIPKSHPLAHKDQTIDCLSCHDTHGTQKEFHFARSSKEKEGDVCLKCHEDKKESIGIVKHLKIDPKIDKAKWPGQEVVCLKCHNPHDAKPKTTQLCLSCHTAKKATHHEKDIGKLYERSRLPIPTQIVLEEGKISCATCHDPHNLSQLDHYLRPRRESIKTVCTTFCHKPDTIDVLFDKYHQRQKKIKKGIEIP